MDKALAAFEKIKSPYLISTVYKDRGDMYSNLQKADDAQNCYEQCIRLRRQVFGDNHLKIAKIFIKLADNMMKERCNDQKLKKAAGYLSKNMEMLKEVL